MNNMDDLPGASFSRSMPLGYRPEGGFRFAGRQRAHLKGQQRPPGKSGSTLAEGSRTQRAILAFERQTQSRYIRKRRQNPQNPKVAIGCDFVRRALIPRVSDQRLGWPEQQQQQDSQHAHHGPDRLSKDYLGHWK